MRQASWECVLPLRVRFSMARHSVSGQGGVGRARQTPIGSLISDPRSPTATWLGRQRTSAGKTLPILLTQGLSSKACPCPMGDSGTLSAHPHAATGAILGAAFHPPRPRLATAKQRRRSGAGRPNHQPARSSQQASVRLRAGPSGAAVSPLGPGRHHGRSGRRQGLPGRDRRGPGQEASRRRDGRWLCCWRG